jgi:hypothetical protein
MGNSKLGGLSRIRFEVERGGKRYRVLKCESMCNLTRIKNMDY